MSALQCFSPEVCNLPVAPVASTSKLSSKHTAMQAHLRMVSSTYPAAVYYPASSCPPGLAEDPSGADLAQWVNKMWMNTTTGILKYYDGTVIRQVTAM